MACLWLLVFCMDVLLEVPSCYMPKRGVSRDAKRLNLSSLLRLYVSVHAPSFSVVDVFNPSFDVEILGIIVPFFPSYGQEIFKAHRWPDKLSRHPPP